MIQPGAKNWIEKYFSLVDENKIDLNCTLRPKEISDELFLHKTFLDTGITFGFAGNFLFFNNKEVSDNWTHDERTAFLLFESLILVYLTEKETLNKDEFIASLLNFYEQYKDKHSISVFKFLFKETNLIKIENILKERTHIRKTFTNQLWVNYFNNSVIYLDVLAFRLFLQHGKELHDSYNKFVLGALHTIAAMAVLDDKIVASEKKIVATYLNASNFTTSEKKEFNKQLEKLNFSIQDIYIPSEVGNLYKFHLIDLAVLTIYSDVSVMDDEVDCLFELCTYLGIEEEVLEQSKAIINHFVIKNNHQITFLQDKTSYEQLYSGFSKRWIKILGRSKDKFITELKENKELISLVNKSLTKELTDKEKEKVKSQFKDLVKSVPAIAVFMLPGGTLLLPLILKIIPDLVPSAFKNN